jgi:hypothetical protein
MNEGDALAVTSTNTMNDGKFDLRQSGRFHRVRVDLTGDHKATAFGGKFIPVGSR